MGGFFRSWAMLMLIILAVAAWMFVAFILFRLAMEVSYWWFVAVLGWVCTVPASAEWGEE